jgi:Mg2+ and Co2+ transporter CorA
MPRVSLLLVATLALAAGTAAPARAELATWDQARVSALAKQLETEARSLEDAFRKQPQATGAQRRSYYRLKQDVRKVRSGAKQLAGALDEGATQEETLPMYEDLMQDVRRVRDFAPQLFTTRDVMERASAARQVLNQITPYYDPDAAPLRPAAR